MKYPPGPWYVSETDIEVCHGPTGVTSTYAMIRAADEDEVCVIGHWDDDERNRAAENLILAAPELHEAVRKALDVLQAGCLNKQSGDWCFNNQEWPELCDCLEAALASVESPGELF